MIVLMMVFLKAPEDGRYHQYIITVITIIVSVINNDDMFGDGSNADFDL